VPKRAWNGHVAALQTFWLKHPRGANTPNWDFASGCTINGRRGLVLVEAKANVLELSTRGKPLIGRKLKTGERLDPSANARDNHDHIRECISATSTSLAANTRGINLSADSNYQFANRITFAAWLAGRGIPVVLIYLGFTGDTAVRGAGKEIRDMNHWSEMMLAHLDGKFPADKLGVPIDCGCASFTLIVRTLPAKLNGGR